MGALLTILVNTLTPNKRKARSNRETFACPSVCMVGQFHKWMVYNGKTSDEKNDVNFSTLEKTVGR